MTQAADKKPFARIMEHLGWIVSGKGYGAVLSLFYLAIVTRSLGPAGYGSFTLILATTLTLQLTLGFNVWQVLIKYGHEHIRSADFEGLARLIRFCTITDIATACLAIIITGLVLWLGQSALGLTDDLAWLTFGYAIAFFFSLRSVPRGILRLKNQFRQTFLAEAAVPTVKFGGALLALVIQPSLGLFVWVWAAGEMVSTVIFWWLALRLCRQEFGRPNGRQWYRAWRENKGLPAMMVATNLGETAHVIGQQLPVLLVGSVVGLAAAGLYRLAHQLTQSLSLLAGFVTLASYTEMANVHAREGVGKLKPLFLKLTLTSFGAALLLAPTMLLLGKPLILLMSGPQFIGAYPVLLVLGLAAGLQILGVSCEPLLMATGRSKTLIAVRVASSAFLIAILFALLHKFGALGAGWARVAAETFGLLLMFAASYNVLRKVRATS